MQAENMIINQLRRKLKQNGYALRKSRRSYPTIDDMCNYMIVDSRINGVVGGGRYDYILDDVVSFVNAYCE